jgi:hypothetical protein
MLAVSYVTYSVINRISAPTPATNLVSSVNSEPATLSPPRLADAPIDSPSITITPAVILAQGNPGNTISSSLIVNNQSCQELNFDMSAEDMVVQQGTLVPFPAGQSPNGIATRVLFSSPSISVKPWHTGSVKVTLTMHLDSSIYAVLIVFKGTDKIPASAGTTFQASLGTLITLVKPVALGQKAATTGEPSHES